MAALKEQWTTSHETCLRCLDTYQHKTIQDAAEWIFKNFDPGMGTSATHTEHQIDLEKLTTMDAVRRAWSEANAISEQIEADKIQALPVGRPGGRNIFERAGDNTVASAWQTFDYEERYPGVYDPMGRHTHTLVTVDHRKDEYHICFTQDPDIVRGGSFVSYEIEALATAMYKRACAEQVSKPQANTPLSGAKGLVARIASMALAGAQPSTPRPEQFHFYIHHGPKPHLREEFREVDLRFDRGQFRLGDSQFTRLDVIPEIIQKAYRNTTSSPADAELVKAPALTGPAKALGYDR